MQRTKAERKALKYVLEQYLFSMNWATQQNEQWENIVF